MYKFCPQCGTTVEPSDKICKSCGARLSDYPRVVPARATRTRLSKNFYVGSIIGGYILALIMMEIGAWWGWLLSLYSAIIGFVLLYKVWAAIQDGHARTTPSKAVGYSFIPFFQLYWLFQAYWGYAKDYNSYISRHDISTSRLPEALFLAYCIIPLAYVGVIVLLAITMPLWLLARMTLVSAVLAVPMYIITTIIVVKLCDAVNNLPG